MDEFQYYNKSDRLEKFKKEFINTLYEILSKYRCVYLFKIEVSSLGRLHLHGYIHVPQNQIQNFYINIINKLIRIGTIEVDELMNNFWIIYLTKQNQIINEWLCSWEIEKYFNDRVLITAKSNILRFL